MVMRQSCTAVAEGQTHGEHSTWVGGDVILLTRSPGALDTAVTFVNGWLPSFDENYLTTLRSAECTAIKHFVLLFIFRYEITMQLRLVLNSGSSCLGFSHIGVNYHTQLRN